MRVPPGQHPELARWGTDGEQRGGAGVSRGERGSWGSSPRCNLARTGLGGQLRGGQSTSPPPIFWAPAHLLGTHPSCGHPGAKQHPRSTLLFPRARRLAPRHPHRPTTPTKTPNPSAPGDAAAPVSTRRPPSPPVPPLPTPCTQCPDEAALPGLAGGADTDSSHYESYGEDEEDGAPDRAQDRAHYLRWPPAPGPPRAEPPGRPEAQLCGFLWRKRWLGRWAKQLFIVREHALLVRGRTGGTERGRGSPVP